MHGVFAIEFNGALPAGETIIFEDVVPANSTFTNISANPWACSPTTPMNAGTLTCTLTGAYASIPPIVITMTTKEKEVKNCAKFTTKGKRKEAYYNTNLENDEDCTTLIGKSRGDINISKILVDSYLDGDTFYGVFDITFAGSLPAGEVLSISDIVPNNTFFSDINTTGWNCIPNAIISGGDTLTCSIVGEYENIPPIQITMGLIHKETCKIENCVQITDGANTYYNEDMSNDYSCDTLVNPPRSDIAIQKNLITQYEENGTLYGIFKISFDGYLPDGETLNVSDVVPNSTSFTDINASAWNCGSTPLQAGDTLNCQIAGPFVPIPSIAITMKIDQNAEGNITNCAKIDSNGRTYYDTNLNNNQSCDMIEIPLCTGSCIPLSCTTDIIIVADESGSIASPVDHSGTVSASMRTLIGGFKGYGSKASVIYFSDEGASGTRIAFPMQTIQTAGGYPYQEATFLTGYYPTTRETNWEAGLKLAVQEANANPGPEVIFFITDGQPNKYIDDVTGLEQSGSEAQSLAHAVAVANQLNSSGSRIVAIGIGDFAASPTAQNNLQQIAAEVNDSIVVPVSELQNVIAQYAYEACPTLAFEKYGNWSINLYDHDLNTTKPYFYLRIHNNSLIDLHNIVIEDALPTPQITFNSFFPYASNISTAVESNDVINWHIPVLNAGDSMELMFKVNLSTGLQSGDTIHNYAQVISLDENVSSTPNSFLDSVTGPIDLSERDEGTAYISLYDNPPPPPCRATEADPGKCLYVYKHISAGEGNCNTGTPCRYTVRITNGSDLDYNGTLTISDYFDVGSANISTIAPASWAPLTPTTLCDNINPSSVPFTCTKQGNIPAGNQWIYEIELDSTPLGATKNTFKVYNKIGVMNL